MNMDFFQQVYKGKSDAGRYAIVLILFFIGWQIIGMLPLMGVAFYHSSSYAHFIEASKDTFMNLGIDNNLFLLTVLLSFVIGLISLIFSIKLIHKRSSISVFTSRKKIDYLRVLFSFSLWSIVSVIIISVSIILSPDNYVWNFKLIPFLTLTLISLLLMPLQTTMEELLFRGYLMQGLGDLVKNRWFPLLITSVVFGLMHGLNPEVDKLGNIVMVYYIGTGLLFGIITLMDEGIELAMGFHASNNILAAILVTTDWTVFQTDALFKDISEPSVGWEMFFPVLVVYPIFLIILSKVYRWTNWKQRLVGDINKPYELD